MRLGFEVSDLQPGKAGVYTYSSQLLAHLLRLPDPPTIALLDALGRGKRQEVLEATAGPLAEAPFVQARSLPLLRPSRGPWQKDYRLRRLAWMTDQHVLEPFWQTTRGSSLLARWLLPDMATGPLDVCHWSDGAFIHLPHTAHVMTIHDTVVLRHPEWHRRADVGHHRRKLRLIARHATRIIADSEHTRRDAMALLDIAPERIDVIPLAAGPEFRPPDPAVVREVLARYGLERGGYVLCVGTIEPRKNVVRLAQAFKAAVEGRPELATTKLVLAGQQGWLAAPIEAGLAAVGLGGRLVRPGRVPQADLPALLAGAGAVAYPSLYEGFGLPPLEALACGAAVVASAPTSVPEVVGEAGLLVDPTDVGAIAQALGRVLVDGGLRAELGARGLRRAQQFSWARTAALTMRTYERAVADRATVRRGRVAPAGPG